MAAKGESEKDEDPVTSLSRRMGIYTYLPPCPQTIICLAAVSWDPKKPVQIERIEVGIPFPDEVRVKVAYAGLCPSDLFYIKDCDLTFPVVFGHEGIGVVESVGNKVKSVNVGDTVIFLYVPQCGECALCKNPKTNMCVLIPRANARENPCHRMRCRGMPITQFMDVGCFSEYTVVSEYSCVKVNPAIPLDKGCLFGCCVPCGYGAAVNTAKVEPGSTCVVWGLGAIGLCISLGCRQKGASRVIGVDRNMERYPIAEKFGFTEFVNPDDYVNGAKLEEEITERTNGGADYAFVSASSSEAMKRCISTTHDCWGKTVLIGTMKTGGGINIDPWALVVGRHLTGSVLGGYKGKVHIPLMVESYLKGKLPVDGLITHTLRLWHINEALRLARDKSSIRVILNIEDKL